MKSTQEVVSSKLRSSIFFVLHFFTTLRGFPLSCRNFSSSFFTSELDKPRSSFPLGFVALLQQKYAILLKTYRFEFHVFLPMIVI